MSNAEFGWESLLDSDAPSGCTLKAALFTTYDRAEERLLAEHLLPILLRLTREPDGEGAERQYFLLELDRRLKQLHNRLVVISSTARDETVESEKDESEAYRWIWRSIRHLTVGSRRKAVQHAKLWLLHWGAPDEEGVEYLEFVVSSANLTRAAFRHQLQAAWRACVELRPQRSKARLDGWGVLPDFLRELAASAGEDERLADFLELLERAECPEGVQFVASVPGTHSRQSLRRTPWGTASIAKAAPPGRGLVNVSILSPFVGSWNADTLNHWCSTLKSAPDRVELIWIDKNHPWAAQWILPRTTLKTLTNAGGKLLRLRCNRDDLEDTDLFHEEHRSADCRWSHAKAYLLKRGNSRRLLVTSANFSAAAWGSENADGEMTIENFELGVCVEQAIWPFDDLEAFEDQEDAATVQALPNRGSPLIMWARAVWDGAEVGVDCRCEIGRELEGEVTGSGESSEILHWRVASDGCLRSAQVTWRDSKHPPLLLQLICDNERISVPVFDERPSRERERDLPPEVDEDAAQTMRDELLFEQYGGRVAAEDDGEDEGEAGDTEVGASAESDGPIGELATDGDDETQEDGGGSADSYGVPAFDLARLRLGVVDNWADQVNRIGKHDASDFERKILQQDGEFLVEAFHRQATRDEKKGPACAIGARLAAEELTLRLNQLEAE